MSRPCPARRVTSAAPGAGEQRLVLVAQVAAHPMIEVAAARMLILLVDELRDDGIVLRRIRVELEG
jgi:hypothetical protein